MIHLHSFVFGPFQENTYVVWDDNGLAAVIDPGISSRTEEEEFLNFIQSHNLNLQRVWLTHGHVDHVNGCMFLYKQCKLIPEIHSADLYWVEQLPQICHMYGLPAVQFPDEYLLLDGSSEVLLGEEAFRLLHVPGHSPGCIAFYNTYSKFIVSGDTLFKNSIGRTDFPGGDYDTLIQSIVSRIFSLPDDVRVYPGHGPVTTVGDEKKYNPFFN